MIFSPFSLEDESLLFLNRTLAEETSPSSHSDPPSRIRTRDAIYELYCSFGEKKHRGEDFISRILNIPSNIH